MTSATGKLEVVVTYLEMTRPPVAPPPPPPAVPHAIMRADDMTVSFYRYLYDTVGEKNLWWERRLLSDEALREAIDADNVDIFVLYVGGVPAGYYELRDGGDTSGIELAYFGLIPEFIGRGLGWYLLRTAIDEVWRRRPTRLWLHTCSLDHPNALRVYQRAGFRPLDRQVRVIDDPRTMGLFS